MSRDLKDLHPYVRGLALKLVEYCKSVGIEVSICCTLRTIEEQSNLYEIGRTKPGNIVTYDKPGYSYHNYGLAFDIICKCTEGFPQMSEKELYKAVSKVGARLGLKWGGVSGRECDMNHFSWDDGLTIEDLRKGDLPYRGTDKRREGTKRLVTMNVYVYEKRNVSSKILGMISKGTTVKVFAVDEKCWAEIEFLNKRAFLNSFVLK